MTSVNCNWKPKKIRETQGGQTSTWVRPEKLEILYNSFNGNGHLLET